MSANPQSDVPEGEFHTLAHPKARVAERIKQLLQRCSKLKRASNMQPIVLDDDGDARARTTAARGDEDTEKAPSKFS